MNTVQILSTSVSVTYTQTVERDIHPDLSFLVRAREDEPQMTDEEFNIFAAANRTTLEEYHRGDWYMVGVYCTADIVVKRTYSDGSTYERGYQLSSLGCWGIVSRDADEIRRVFEEEKAQLQYDITAIGAHLSTAVKESGA